MAKTLKVVSSNLKTFLQNMNNDLPRLLLVTEASLNQTVTGLNRTLLNLFEDYPADRIMLFSSDKSMMRHSTSDQFQQNIISFKEEFIPYVHNRLGLYLNSFFAQINYQLTEWLPLANYDRIANFAPEIILICPNFAIDLVVGYKTIHCFDVPFLIYFMDDWVALNHSQWLSSNVQYICKFMLQKSSGWLMISSQLELKLIHRYNINPQRSLVIHNPVSLREKVFPDFIANSGKTFKIVYTGAIWPMHYDAIAVVAKAIQELRDINNQDIELVVHTPPEFWKYYQQNLEKWGVVNGSYIPHSELNQYLQKANLLLVASSFLPENHNLTSSSVQTKLTDYMASGRPILSCGPKYAACNEFVKKWDIGLVIESNQVADIKTILLKCIDNTVELKASAQKAFEIVRDCFEINIVRSNLHEFIKQTIMTQ